MVLSGGGFRGAFQLGALNFLAENWATLTGEQSPMKFDLIAGVSVGALNGAMMAQNKLEDLNQLWDQIAEKGVEEIYTSDFIDTTPGTEELKLRLDFDRLKERFIPNFAINLNLWKGLGLLLSKKKRAKFLKEQLEKAGTEFGENFNKFRSLADNSPLYEKLKQYLDNDQVDEDCIFYTGFVSLEDGEYHSVPHYYFAGKEDYVKGVLASSAMPIVWEPIKDIRLASRRVINSVDGGIRNTAPLGDLIRVINQASEPDTEYVFIVINCNNGLVLPEDYSTAGIGKIALRSLMEIAQAEIFNNDLDQFLTINDLVDQAQRLKPGASLKHFNSTVGTRTDTELKRFRAMVIKPANGTLGDMLTITPASYARRVQHGRSKASEALEGFITSEAPVTVRGDI